LILFHGQMLTVDSHDSVVQALAVRDGKIIAIGTDREILRLAGSATRRIDLHGRTATPGLIDSHAHIADAGVDELYHVRLSDARHGGRGRAAGGRRESPRSSPANGCRVRAGTRASSPNGAMSPRRILTGCLPAIRCGWMHTTGHYGVANSAALRLAKIDRRHQGSARRHHRSRYPGPPTGVLKESAKDAVLD
jgi:predicted amidohydrolase YtcJ